MTKEVQGRILAWNVKNGLEGDGALAIADTIAEQEPTIVILTEAATEPDRVSPRARRALTDIAGGFAEIPYDDADKRADTHTLVVLSRPEHGPVETVRLHGRNGALLRPDTKLSVLGFHGYDRKARNPGDPKPSRWDHETMRYTQTQSALARVGTYDALIAGDLNTMPRRSLVARLLRAAAPFVYRLPAGEPNQPQSKVERIGSLTQRASAMAIGRSLERFEGFEDVDPDGRTTASIGPIRAQLDHILARGANLRTSSFEVIPADGLSDHDAVVADFEYVPRER